MQHAGSCLCWRVSLSQPFSAIDITLGMDLVNLVTFWTAWGLCFWLPQSYESCPSLKSAVDLYQGETVPRPSNWWIMTSASPNGPSLLASSSSSSHAALGCGITSVVFLFCSLLCYHCSCLFLFSLWSSRCIAQTHGLPAPCGISLPFSPLPLDPPWSLCGDNSASEKTLVSPVDVTARAIWHWIQWHVCSVLSFG